MMTYDEMATDVNEYASWLLNTYDAVGLADKVLVAMNYAGVTITKRFLEKLQGFERVDLVDFLAFNVRLPTEDSDWEEHCKAECDADAGIPSDDPYAPELTAAERNGDPRRL